MNFILLNCGLFSFVALNNNNNNNLTLITKKQQQHRGTLSDTTVHRYLFLLILVSNKHEPFHIEMSKRERKLVNHLKIH